MTLQIFNTLDQKKSPLKTLEENKVKMYVCGPTVYDDCHIGHLMGPILFDGVARWLKAVGYEVSFVNNITDIDDKIINRSITTGEDWQAITKRYTAQYKAYLQELNITTVTDFPQCTDYIPHMIDYIQGLIEKERAYEISDGVYYEVSKQADYGKLSKRKLEDMLSGSRVESNSELKNSADFCLWKKAKPGEPSWESPWGNGRPGWHIECSVMSKEILGASFDIHGGGDDLKFPHHENELAQGEAHGGHYASYWMHNGLIQYDGVKIGKSDPRMKDPEFSKQFAAAYLLEKYGQATLRFFLLQGHYRRPNDFAPKNIENSQISLNKLLTQLGSILENNNQLTLEEIKATNINDVITKHTSDFIQAMNDDFNTAGAIGHLFTIAKEVNKLESKTEGLILLLSLGRTIGLFQLGDSAQEKQVEISPLLKEQLDEFIQSISTDFKPVEKSFEENIQYILQVRQESRKNKDFATADKIRDSFNQLGIIIEDSPDGAKWQIKK